MLQLSEAHLLHFPLSSISLNFENQDVVTISTKGGKLESLVYRFGEREIEIPKGELIGVLKVEIASVTLSSTDLDRPRIRYVEFDFVSAVLGKSSVRFYFTGEKYSGRVITGPPDPEIEQADPFGEGARLRYRKLVGQAEEKLEAK